MGALKVTELEKKLIDKGLTLSPLAVSACRHCTRWFHTVLLLSALAQGSE